VDYWYSYSTGSNSAMFNLYLSVAEEAKERFVALRGCCRRIHFLGFDGTVILPN
jgi:hypothetical protein